MTWSVDARVPLRFGALADAAEGDALLLEGDAPAGSRPAARFAVTVQHAAGCLCCLPRNPAAQALAQLFHARAKGEVAFFRRVLAVTETADGDATVWAALRADPLVMGRFRME